MSFTEQLVQFLSEPPSSFFYHLLVLFALMVVFALSYARARQERAAALARRSALAAAAIFVAKSMVLFSGFLLGGDPERATLLLPPLESAVDTISLAWLIWSFLAQPAQVRRITNIILIAVLFLCGLLFLFTWQTWQTAVTAGVVSYNGSSQANVWSMLQIALLSAGLAYLLLRERRLGALPPAILITLLLAHIATFWNVPEVIATTTNVAYWNRLGYLIALPLWAVFTYEQLVAPPPAVQVATTIQSADFEQALSVATRIIASRQTSRRVAIGLALCEELLDASFTAVAFLDADNPDTLVFRSNLPDGRESRFRQWEMAVDDNPALQTAIAQDRAVELQAAGLGARQFFAMYAAAQLEPRGALLVQPLTVAGRRLGVLLLAAKPEQEHWSPEAQQAADVAAGFLAAAVADSQNESSSAPIIPSPETPAPAAAVPAAIVMDRARLRDLERERDELRAALDQAVEAREAAESSAVAAQKQARYLAAALRVAQTKRVADEAPLAAADDSLEEIVAAQQTVEQNDE